MPTRRPRWTNFLRRSNGLPPQVLLALGLGVCLWLLAVGCLTTSDQKIAQQSAATIREEPAPFDRQIRVRLLGHTPVTSFDLQIATRWRLIDSGSGMIISEFERPLANCRVSPARQNSGAIMLGTARVDATDVRVEPGRDASVVVNGRTYRGALRVRRVAGGLVVTNIVDVESYLAGVLRGELPRKFHPQAQRALAVAARTFVFYEKLTAPRDQDYDVLADERSQMYVGVRGEDSRAVQAVESTLGEICAVQQDGRELVFSTYYSSCCGGLTQNVIDFRPSDPAVAPLSGGVRCTDCADAPTFRWATVRLTKADITRRLIARYPRLSRLGQVLKLEPELRGGRFIAIRVIGSGGTSERLAGEDFRLAMGGHVIKSTRCDVVDEGRAVAFANGRGFGHGVGLCQYGADHQARRGRTYRDILRYYYPGAILKRIY